MKTKRFTIYAILIATVFLFNACGGDEPIKRGSLTPARFDLPANNSSAKRGQSIRVQVEIPSPENVETVKIYTSDTVIYEGDASGATKAFEVSTANWKIGTNQISMTTKTKDSKSRTEHRIVKVFPDLIPTEYTAEVIKVYPHNTSFYTQGLEFDGDQLYEGTGGQGDGRLGPSVIAKVDLNTAEVQMKKTLENKYFGEGITIFGDLLYQLTWQENTCFVYDKNTLEEIRQITYTGEGWGLCNDGEQLIMSDGSERIYFRDPDNFSIKRVIEVYTNLGPVKGINELEYIEGKIYANVYTTNNIIIIDAETGIVTGNIDATMLALDYREGGEVLNGIAYKHSTKQLFVTGKDWPNMLEIALVEE